MVVPHLVLLVIFLKESSPHPFKDTPCWISGKIKEHILEETIPTGLKEMLLESVEFALPGESIVKTQYFWFYSPAQRCLLYCLSHSKEILEFFSKTFTNFQTNTWNAKKVVDINSNTGVSLFTYITNCQALVSAKFPWVNKVYFAWYEYCYFSFLWIFICMEYLFLSPHFQSVCAPRSDMGLL